VVPFGAEFVDPPVVYARVMVVAHGRKPAVENFALCWVFDLGFHGILLRVVYISYHIPCLITISYIYAHRLVLRHAMRIMAIVIHETGEKNECIFSRFSAYRRDCEVRGKPQG